MDLYRIGVKIFTVRAVDVRLKEFVPVFHRWISRGALSAPLVDVADYTHVQGGPGVLLAGFEANYSVQNVDGAVALTWYRKRPTGVSFEEGLVAGAKGMFLLGEELEAEPEFFGRLAFGRDALMVFSNDRLLAPNGDSTLREWRSGIESLVRNLWGEGVNFSLQRDERADERFCVFVRREPAAEGM